MAKISDLKFDDKNFNKHTEYGMSLLEKSLRELGAGRSILLDNRKQVSVWEFGRENVSGHTTPKPIAMVCNAITNSSLRKENVLDLFGGSGSTLIACEQLGRKCYMMELDPKYCDVIRKRYWKFVTGSEEGWENGTK